MKSKKTLRRAAWAAAIFLLFGLSTRLGFEQFALLFMAGIIVSFVVVLVAFFVSLHRSYKRNGLTTDDLLFLLLMK